MDLGHSLPVAFQPPDPDLIADEVRSRVSDLRSQLGIVRVLEPENLIRPELGDSSFVDQTDRVREVIRLAREIDLGLLLMCPINRFSQLLAMTRQLVNAVEAMRSMGLKNNPSPMSRRNQIATEFDTQAKQWTAAVDPVLAYQAHLRFWLMGLESPDKITAGLADARNQSLRYRDELAAIVKAVRDQANEGAIGINAQYFGGQAKEHSTASFRWLCAAGVAITATGSWLAYLFLSAQHWVSQPPATEPGAAALVQLAVAKALVFSVLASSVVWCAKNYRSHRHNYIVNRHRRNALATFDTLAKSNTDESVRRGLIVQAASSIFAPQPTGYASAEGSDAPQVSTVVDLARAG